MYFGAKQLFSAENCFLGTHKMASNKNTVEKQVSLDLDHFSGFSSHYIINTVNGLSTGRPVVVHIIV